MSSQLPAESSLSPAYGAHPTIITTFPNPKVQKQCPIYLHYTFPPLLIIDAHELALRNAHYTVLGLRGRGSRELEKPVHALPLSDEPMELVTRLAPSNDTLLEVQLPIHVRYAEPLGGGDLTLSFDGPRVFTSCDQELREGKVPWEVLQGYSVSQPPPTKLKIQVPVGDRQADLAVVEFGTAFTILLCFVWVVFASWKTFRRLALRDKVDKME